MFTTNLFITPLDLDVAGIRKEFNIKNDFTPEEEKQISEEVMGVLGRS